jgi:uncharacterized repeat protein (TIGR03803 family)
VLYRFSESGDNGLTPGYGDLVFDRAGNLYGTTINGGAHNAGVAYELTPSGTESILYNFVGATGQYPYNGVVFDSAGNLYGTTYEGGNVYGTIFELTSSGSGGWADKTLHMFQPSTDGGNPYGGVIFDQAGNLYGTTSILGTNRSGTVFESSLFLFHRRVELYSGTALFRRKWVTRSVLAVQLLLGLYFSTLCLYQAQVGNKIFDANVGPPLYGAWSVEEYAVEGKVVPQPPSPEDQWQRVFFQNSQRLVVETGSGVRERFFLKLDEKQHTLKLVNFADSNWKADFSYQSPQSKVVTLTGQMNGYRVDMRLRQLDTPKSFLLTSRGFHWINEHPFNQ